MDNRCFILTNILGKYFLELPKFINKKDKDFREKINIAKNLLEHLDNEIILLKTGLMVEEIQSLRQLVYLYTFRSMKVFIASGNVNNVNTEKVKKLIKDIKKSLL